MNLLPNPAAQLPSLDPPLVLHSELLNYNVDVVDNYHCDDDDDGCSDVYDNDDLVRQVPYVVEDVEDVQRRFGNWTMEKRANTPEKCFMVIRYPRKHS